MRSDILKLRIIRDLTYHLTTQEELLTPYDMDMFWEILDEMSATRQQEIWDCQKCKKQEESADT